MKAQITFFASQTEAAAEALAFRNEGWETAITGPLEQTRVFQEDNYVAGYAGKWLMLASRVELRSPD
jgi:hypothetical protein